MSLSVGLGIAVGCTTHTRSNIAQECGGCSNIPSSPCFCGWPYGMGGADAGVQLPASGGAGWTQGGSGGLGGATIDAGDAATTGDAPSDGGAPLRCCDGTLSSCGCGDESYQGCCVQHGGVCGCAN